MKLRRATFDWIRYPGGKHHLVGLYWDSLSARDIYELSRIKGDVPFNNPSIHPFYDVKPITNLTIVH